MRPRPLLVRPYVSSSSASSTNTALTPAIVTPATTYRPLTSPSMPSRLGSAPVRTRLLAVAIVVLAGCGDDDGGGETAPTVTGPAPSEDVSAGAYADEWNLLSESLDVATVDNELPSTESGNWQLRL